MSSHIEGKGYFPFLFYLGGGELHEKKAIVFVFFLIIMFPTYVGAYEIVNIREVSNHCTFQITWTPKDGSRIFFRLFVSDEYEKQWSASSDLGIESRVSVVSRASYPQTIKVYDVAPGGNPTDSNLVREFVFPSGYTCTSPPNIVDPPDNGGNNPPGVPGNGNISDLRFNSSSNALNWSTFPDCVGYAIYLNGSFLGQTPYTNFPINQPGTYEVVAVNDLGQPMADSTITVTSDMFGDSGGSPIPDPDDPYEPPPGGGIGDYDPDDIYDPIPPSEDPFCSVCMAQVKRILQDISYNTADALYELDDLNRTARQIRNAVEDSLSELRQLNQTANSIDRTTQSIDRELKDFHNQFKTNRSFHIPNANDYEIPQHKPQMHEEPFRDNNIYFQDSGSAESPPPLPKAIEPTDNWDGIFREAEQSRDKALTKSPVMNKDSVLESDAPLQRSEVLERDELTRTEEYERTEKHERTGVFERFEPMEQDNTDYQLRWRMKEGVIQ